MCGVSRQSIHNWLIVAQGMGFVDLHEGRPRGLQLLPKGRKLADKFALLPTIDAWKHMREELKKDTHEYQRTDAEQ